jgi:DNA-binding MurR/RpiR family transcriptional regulator
VFKLTIQTLKDTLEILDYNEYNKALEALIAAKRVYFAGTGDAAAVASAAAVKFTRIGYDSQSFNDPDLMLMGASHMKKNDVYVLISHSGRTKSLVNIAKYLKSSDVTTISITNFPATPLVKNSDICIFTSAFVQELEGEVMANRVVGLCIIESLFTDVVVRCMEKRRFIEKCENATRKNKL